MFKFNSFFSKINIFLLDLFEKSDSVDFSYTICLGLELSEKIKEYFRLIGKLIVKALLENVTINLCFNKIIYKIILNEKVTFDDLIFINKPVKYLT